MYCTITRVIPFLLYVYMKNFINSLSTFVFKYSTLTNQSFNHSINQAFRHSSIQSFKILSTALSITLSLPAAVAAGSSITNVSGGTPFS